MTYRHSAIFHLMLAAMVGYIAAYAVQRKGMYEKLKEDYLIKVKAQQLNWSSFMYLKFKNIEKSNCGQIEVLF